MGICNCCKDQQILKPNLIDSETQTDDDYNINEQLINGKIINSDIIDEKKIQLIKAKNEITTEEKKMPYEIVLKDFLDEKINNTDIFPEKWYREEEKSKIIFSRRSIIAIINYEFDENNKDYNEIYNKPPLVISIKSNGTFINNEFQIVKSIFTAPKNTLPPNINIDTIAYYLIFEKKRNEWDPQIKEYKLIEGEEKNGLLYIKNKSPMIFVSERDIVEKKFDFMYNGSYYLFESSVNDEFYPIEKNVVRTVDIVFATQICEDENNFYFKNLTQMDAKVSLPQTLLNTALPNNITNYFTGGIKAMNNDYENGKLEMKEKGFIQE